MRRRYLATMLVGLALVLLFSAGLKSQTNGSSDNTKQETGFAVKKPVFAGACKTCPYGAIAEIVKTAMKPYGYDVQICYNCAGVQGARYVADAMMPPPIQLPPGLESLAKQMGPAPEGPVDFGTTYADYLWWAYQGVHDFDLKYRPASNGLGAVNGEGPRKNVRLIAKIQDPTYLIAAVRADSGISDLHQIMQKHMKVRILTVIPDTAQSAVLAYYGITKEAVEAAGGHMAAGFAAGERKDFDVIIGTGTLDNTPEYNVWYEVSQRFNLTYLQLPDDLLAKMVKDFDMVRVDLPDGMLRGLDQPIHSVARSGTVIFGRTDMPNDFAYTAAKALDEHQDLLQWTNASLHFSYNAHTVWKAFGVPLHPGAEGYYREKGYMK